MVTVALIGADGAGKTTAIRLMCGLLHADEGEVRTLGNDPARNHRRVTEKVGYLSQRFSLYGDLTIDENIAFFAEIHGVGDYQQRRDRLLEMTPLTRFRNVAEEALISGDAAAMREALARALEEADRVNATLNALIDISEAESGTMRLVPESVDLARIATEAVELYADEAEEKGVALQSHIEPETRLFGDRTRLRQVLANLIENAVKYTERGGRVDIEATGDPRRITLTIRDTGVGISADDAPFVWDRLYRADASRSARGLGLGLSLVKAIVEAHGGQVSLTSTPGQGSVFGVTLPRTSSSS